MDNNKKKSPCVNIKKVQQKDQQISLKDLARKLASRKPDLSDNPAIKRLEERFRKI